MIRLALLLVLACSCVTSRARVEPAGPPMALTRDPSRATVTRTAEPVPPMAQRCEVARLPPRPAEPVIDWLAQGCPAKFMACLSGSDFEALRLYLQSIQQWARDADRRCSRDR